MKILFIFLCLLTTPLYADEITHQLGNATYAVRFARIEGAAKDSPQDYWKSVRLLRQAQIHFANRQFPKAIEVSKQAEALAWQAYHKSRN